MANVPSIDREPDTLSADLSNAVELYDGTFNFVLAAGHFNTLGGTSDLDWFHIGPLSPGKPANIAVLPDLFRTQYPGFPETLTTGSEAILGGATLWRKVLVHQPDGSTHAFVISVATVNQTGNGEYIVKDHINEQGGVRAGSEIEFYYFTNIIDAPSTLGDREYTNDYYLAITGIGNGSRAGVDGPFLAPNNGRYLVYKASPDFTGIPTYNPDGNAGYVDPRDAYFGQFVELVSTLDGHIISTSGAQANLNSVTGGAGNDSLKGGPANDVLVGGGGNDTLDGGAGDDTLEGGSGNDTLEGGPGNDRLFGGAGNDMFDWSVDQRGGNDSMWGGAGDDIYVLGGSDVVIETPDEGADLIWTEQSYSLVALPDVERLALFGDAAARLTGNDKPNMLSGNAANNVLFGLGGNDTIEGNGGKDQLNGGGGNDILNGGAGNDVLNGGAGADVLLGGVGNDTLIWDKNDSRVDGGGGNLDVLKAGALNLTKIDNAVIKGIEVINMTNSANNTLTLNAKDVLDLSSSTNELRVLGNDGDSVKMAGTGWTNASDNLDGFDRYTHSNGAILQIADVLTIV
jgi:Ca2+-binding RTX toxin-like protein